MYRTGYLDLVGITWSWEGNLHVQFQDLSFCDIKLDKLCPPGFTIRTDDLREIRVEGPMIHIPAFPQDLKIQSWRIRELTDPAFAQHIEELAQSQREVLGRQLKLMRRKRDLDYAALGRMLGARGEDVENAERGKVEDVRFYSRAAEAMGYETRYLAAQEQ
jgi:hypothetical protein